MNKVLMWTILGLVVVVVVAILALVPVVRRSQEPSATPTPYPTFSTQTPLPTATPTPEALTPDKEQLSDLETAEKEFAVGADYDSDLNQLDGQLKGI